jgi:chromosome segregation ATPase
MARRRHSNLRDSAVTKTKLNISVSPSTFRNLEQIAKQLKLSQSNLIEKIAKGEIAIAAVGAKENINLEIKSREIEQTERTSSSSSQSSQIKSKNLVDREVYSQLQRQLLSYQTKIEQLNQQLAQQEAKLKKQHNQFQSLQQELSTKNQQISQLEEQLKQIDRERNSQSNNLISNVLLLLVLMALVALLVKSYYLSTIVLN